MSVDPLANIRAMQKIAEDVIKLMEVFNKSFVPLPVFEASQAISKLVAENQTANSLARQIAGQQKIFLKLQDKEMQPLLALDKFSVQNQQVAALVKASLYSNDLDEQLSIIDTLSKTGKAIADSELIHVASEVVKTANQNEKVFLKHVKSTLEDKDFSILPLVTPQKSIQIDIARNEGMAFIQVFTPQLNKLMVNASSSIERRAILFRKKREIVAKCRVALEDEFANQFSVAFILNSISAFEKGEYAAAQALVANTLDSILKNQLFPNSHRTAVFSEMESKIENKENASMSFLIVASAICSTYKTYFSQGDNPEKFNRHASIHHVSESQYNEINYVHALVLTVEILYLIKNGKL